MCALYLIYTSSKAIQKELVKACYGFEEKGLTITRYLRERGNDLIDHLCIQFSCPPEVDRKNSQHAHFSQWFESEKNFVERILHHPLFMKHLHTIIQRYDKKFTTTFFSPARSTIRRSLTRQGSMEVGKLEPTKPAANTAELGFGQITVATRLGSQRAATIQVPKTNANARTAKTNTKQRSLESKIPSAPTRSRSCTEHEPSDSPFASIEGEKIPPSNAFLKRLSMGYDEDPDNVFVDPPCPGFHVAGGTGKDVFASPTRQRPGSSLSSHLRSPTLMMESNVMAFETPVKARPSSAVNVTPVRGLKRILASCVDDDVLIPDTPDEMKRRRQ
jgi:hypothetical protein